MKAWSPDWYHWFRFVVAVVWKLLVDILYCSRSFFPSLSWVHVLESPPVLSLVPLKVVGAPTQEYDMMSAELLPLGEARELHTEKGQEEVKRWWVDGCRMEGTTSTRSGCKEGQPPETARLVEM